MHRDVVVLEPLRSQAREGLLVLRFGTLGTWADRGACANVGGGRGGGWDNVGHMDHLQIDHLQIDHLQIDYLQIDPLHPNMP